MTKPADGQIAKVREFWNEWVNGPDGGESLFLTSSNQSRTVFKFAAAFAESERQAVKEECCRAVCYLCAGKHANYNPQPIISEEYHAIFHVALDAKTDTERDRTMERCRAAAIRSME